MRNKLNVIFILADQHNAKCLGSSGHSAVITPNLDRLAREGVKFNNAVCQNPICTPSRMSFLSGQYCHNHGYYGLEGPNPDGLPTLPGHLRRYGYMTAAIGKIHCPEYWVEDDSDIYHETCGCSIGRRSKEYEKFLSEKGMAEYEDHGGLHEFGQKGWQSMEGRPSRLSFEESQEGWIAKTAIEAIEKSMAADKPFFIHASFPRPHQCTSPSKEFWDMYEGVELPLPPNADYSMDGQSPAMTSSANAWREGKWALLEPKTFEAARLRKLRGYLAAITQVDHAVGKIMEFIKKSGIGDDTLVVYSSDHGDYACEHGIMEKAPGISHDAITRIPMIWHAPARIANGHIADELVESVDLAPTICGLAGLEPMQTADGKDLSELLNGTRCELRKIAVTENVWSRSVRKGDWRLVWYPDAIFKKEHPGGFGELYNLKDDPWEMKNLYFEPKYSEKVSELRCDLLEWLVTTTRSKTTLFGATASSACTGDWQRRLRYRNPINMDGKSSPSRILEQNMHHRNYI